jgi:hypothetical protein
VRNERTERSRSAIHATDEYKRQIDALHRLGDKMITWNPDQGVIYDVLIAARKVAMNRHTHKAGVENIDVCGVCGDDLRSSAHYRVGESAKTDMDALRNALSACLMIEGIPSR